MSTMQVCINDTINVFAITQRSQGLKLLKNANATYDDLMELKGWVPQLSGDPVRISTDVNSRLEIIYDELRPVIKGVDVDVFWAYDPDHLARAFKIFHFFSKPCVVKALAKPAPLWIEEDKNDNLKSDVDGIVLVAPRVHEEARK